MPGTDKNTVHQDNADKKQDNQSDDENVSAALQQAEKDIEKDPDLTHDAEPTDDLDEGELTKLEGQE